MVVSEQLTDESISFGHRTNFQCSFFKVYSFLWYMIFGVFLLMAMLAELEKPIAVLLDCTVHSCLL